jgi:hypothetical protein
VRLIAALLLNSLFAVAVLMSIQMAAGWGEMAGIPAGGDKSGLGGLFSMLILMGIRWSALALLLLIVAVQGTFASLPGGRWSQFGIVLGAHAVLGVISYLGFNAVAEGLTADNLGPQRWSPLFGIVLPLPALLITGWAVNRDFFARHPRIGVTLALVITFGHLLIFRQRSESMRRPLHAESASQQSPAPS